MQAWGTEAWAGSQHASSTRWPRCSSPPQAMVCATSTACLGNPFVNGWQQENPDNWLRDGDPWEICPAARESGNQVELHFQAERRVILRSFQIGRRACSVSRLIVRWWATEEKRSTLSASGPPLHPTTSIFRNLAPAISWARWAKRCKRNR